MVEEVFHGIYKTVLRNETVEQGVSEINIYMIPGGNEGRSLMIDAGFRQEHCLRDLERAMEELHIIPEKLDVFLTHRHHDHSGLAGILAERGAVLYMNPEEERHPYDCLTYKPVPESVIEQERVLHSTGVSEAETPEVWKRFKTVTKRVQSHGEWVLAVNSFPYREIHAGESFHYGDYHFESIALRGHTYGQLGLMDVEKKVFFVADQLIFGLSPIVATTYPDEKLLESFFDSLEYIKRRCSEGWTVLSAHGRVISGGEDVRHAVDKSVFSYLEKSSKVKEILEERLSTDRNREFSGENVAEALKKNSEGCAGIAAEKLTERELGETSGKTEKGIKKASGEMSCREVMEICYHVKENPGNEDELFKYKMTLTKTYSILEYLHDIGFVERREEAGTFYWRISPTIGPAIH